jgi:protein-L-isoaspartate(D-aspartate) O-methyltransferase
MQSQAELVQHLIRTGILRSPALIDAFSTIDRIDFVRPEYQHEAYGDFPLPIGYGQTISQPYTVAFMLEALQPGPEDTILDIGSGSGWTTALLARCAKDVTGVERIAELVTFARDNLARYNFDNASVQQAGRELGIPSKTFDKILVSAAADELPRSLLEQLNPGGTLVIPIRNSIVVLNKMQNGEISQRTHQGFVFVPLI